MRDYQKFLRVRRPKVQELRKVGFTMDEIVAVLGCSRITIANDIRAMRAAGACLEHPRKTAEVFAAILRRYAQLSLAEREDVELEQILVERPEIQVLRGFLEGIVLHRAAITRIGDVLPLEYRLLIKEIWHDPVLFGDPITLDKGSRERDLIESCWTIFLGEVCRTSSSLTQQAARRELLKIVTDRSHIDDVVLYCNVSQMISLVDDALNQLHPREAMVLRMRCGLLGSQAMKLEKIAHMIGVTRERVRQIEARAIRHIKEDAGIKTLRKCATTGWSLKAWCAELEKNLQKLEIELQELKGTLAQLQPPIEADSSVRTILCRPVEGLELSVRSNNCLRAANIRYVGELVQRTRYDLLRIKNFGRQCILEIEDAVGELHPELSLGMTIENWSPPST